MGLFGKKKNPEVERLEAELKTAATPLTYASLSERYIAGGEEDRAYETARKGAELFPDSERIQTTFHNIAKGRFKAKILDLQKQIIDKPSAMAYAVLADLYYRELGDRDRALELAREGILAFPDKEDLHLINGLVRYDRFQECYLAHDAARALEHLEKVAAINPQNYKALRLLANLCASVGAFSRAEKHLNALLRVAPEDENGRALLSKVKGLGKESEEDLEALLQTVEERGELSEQARALFPAKATTRVLELSTADLERRLREELNLLKQAEGISAAVVLNHHGATVCAFAPPEMAQPLLAEVMHSVHEMAEDVSKRMDIGGFSGGSIEMPGGTVTLTELRRYVLAVLSAPTARAESVQRIIDRYLDAVLRTAG
ncbi:MAG: tetratricopeptide repeat protein [Planctomycetes bacterium]|nr:tetratricopeptide repeat protein [Planctomycetota bacterium]